MLSTWRRRPGLDLLALLALNLYICWRLFRVTFLPYLGSVELAYLTLTRYTREHWGDLLWFPLWYNGMPWQNTYQPGLFTLAALLPFEPAQAYHIVAAALYAIGPVALCLFVRSFTGSRATGLLAGLCWSLLSFSTFLIPVVRQDVGGFLNPRRYQCLILYGEAPNVCGLSLVPVALWTMHRALQRRTPARCALAMLALGATVLVSWPASVALTIGLVAYVFAAPAHRWPVLIGSGLALGVASYAVISPFTWPSTVKINRYNSQFIGGDYRMTPKMQAALIGVTLSLLLLRWLLPRLGTSQLMQFAVYWAWPLAAVALGAHWFNLALLPQPERFHLALELPLCVLAGHLLWRFWDRLGGLQSYALVLLVISAAVQGYHLQRYARIYTRNLDVTATSMYRVAQWYLSNRPYERAFIPGAAAWGFNYWNETPQTAGCCLPGVVNPLSKVMTYIIGSGDGTEGRDAAISLLWLKAFGARSVTVSSEGSDEPYLDIQQPRKFDGVLPLLWRERGVAVYAVPHASSSIARVVPRRALVQQMPESGLDIKEIARYVGSLDDPAAPLVEWHWLGQGWATVEAHVPPGCVISVPITYHPGWEAISNGRPLPVESDGLGHIVLDPACNGSCRVELTFTGGREWLWTRIASALTLLALAVWAIVHRRYGTLNLQDRTR